MNTTARIKTYEFETNELNGYSNIISRFAELAEYDLELDREASNLPIDPIHEDDEDRGEGAMDAWAAENGYVKVETKNFDNTNADATFYVLPATLEQAMANDPDFTPIAR